MTRVRIKPEMTSNARSLRSDMTDVERILWHAIRGRQLRDRRFRRQHVFGNYIADFACIEKKLLIELDGGQHQEQISYGAKRTEFMEANGWKVIRFWNNDVIQNLDGVLARILENLSNA